MPTDLEKGRFLLGDHRCADQGRDGLQQNDPDSGARDDAVEHRARLQPHAAALLPPQQGVDELHRAEDAQEDRVPSVSRPVPADEVRRRGRHENRCCQGHLGPEAAMQSLSTRRHCQHDYDTAWFDLRRTIFLPHARGYHT